MIKPDHRAFGVGMLVDNSIVVFENILKKRELGLPMRQSAVEGSNEMFLSIVASTIATVIVFLPLAFVGAELQKLYSGMAVTVCATNVLALPPLELKTPAVPSSWYSVMVTPEIPVSPTLSRPLLLASR